MVFEPIFERENWELQYGLHSLERVRFVYDLLDPELRSWFKRDTMILRAHYSTKIEGNTLRQEQVDELMESARKAGITLDEREVLNYIETLKWIDEFSEDDKRPIDEGVIRHLHNLILNEIDPTILTPGAYRKGQNYVRNPLSRRRVFMPPDAGDVPALMRDFSLWLRQALKEGEHPVLVAGIAHLELLAIHPFWDGNGRVARAFSTLIMQRLKYGFEKLIVLDSYFGFDLRDYYEQIGQATGQRYEQGRDITAWLVYFVKGVSIEAEVLNDRMVDASLLRQERREAFKAKGLKARQADGVAYCRIRGQIRPKDYQRIAGVSPAMASQDLRELEDNEILMGRGQTRNRAYVLHPNVEEQIQEQREERAQEEPIQLGLL